MTKFTLLHATNSYIKTTRRISQMRTTFKLYREINKLNFNELLSNNILFNGKNLNSNSLLNKINKDDFIIYPDFLNLNEQRILLDQLLSKLNRVCGKPIRNKVLDQTFKNQFNDDNLQKLFNHPDLYRWEQSHFDNVITSFREASIRSFSVPNQTPAEGVHDILNRLYQCLYQNSTSYTRALADDASNNVVNDRLENDDLRVPNWLQSHILHLSDKGSIDPHVDNEEAMGQVIMGLSLGEERIVKLENDEYGSFTLKLPSGSVYIQKNKFRYEFKHSILRGNDQRITLMLRVSVI